MAKSNKKVRSERINALRKQYDAFLEEDKKRRDRNEFILRRLEKMRLGSPAPLSVYHENTQVVIKPVLQRSDFLNKLSCRDSNKTTILDQSLTLPNYDKNMEETTILKEISKKFILIPKLQSAPHNNITYPSIENIKDTDWRSKYNILDELKRNEKETTHEKSDYVYGSKEDNKTTRCMEPSLSPFDPPVLDDCIKLPPNDLSNESVNNIVSKDETPYSDFKPVAKDILNIPEENIERKQQMVEQTEVSMKNTRPCDINFEANGMPEDSKIINKIHERTNVDLDNKNSVEHNIQRETPAESRIQPKIEENIDTSRENHESNISVNFDNDNNQQEIIKEKAINVSENRGLDIINDQDNSTVDAQQQPLQQQHQTIQQLVQKMPYSEINQEVINKDKVDVNEAFQENIEESENNVLLNNPVNYDSKEAHEQHSNVEVNNENNHEVTYADGDKNYANIQENNESENYIGDNEHYTNEYNYYDESQQGEPYVGEINEHVESTEQYDPNYEQQYTNNYEDPDMEQYQNNQYAENMYQEEETSNISYDNQQPSNANFEYVNSDNIEVTGQNQDENAVNYENEINVQQQYDNNIPQEYSTVQNKQYEEQQQEYTEPEISSNIENKVDTSNS